VTPKPDYDDIDRLERELLPHLFEEEEPPTPPPTPPPPRKRKPGWEEPLRLEDLPPVMTYAASAISPATIAYWDPPPKPKIYDRHGRLL